ncbi:Helix-turn-helix domain-containing protein [Pilibacter termitis]|uniref:Helix-turn-helix domain-containing protein n=1 Tax=Pilibacter termitis TaxID=263852 RepID=A0A1T4LJ81_9ENTE|nr:Rgg/GadR/MutR family transcriptional regulator [Pilibacter termitis]SJZ54775.1 Helix-turn-helix domain-containing protein [Pilibacter termitis]
MHWNYGKIYRKIRKAKGISQQAVCKDIISRVTLSHFENGKHDPNYVTMQHILRQIDMSFDEFEFICNMYLSEERENIIKDLHSSFSSANIEHLKEIKKRCENYLKVNEDIAIEEINGIVSSWLHLIENNLQEIDEKSKEFVHFIWQRLSKMDTWYSREISLINSILFLFPIETTVELFPRLMKTLDRYDGFYEIETKKATILVNVSTIFLTHHYFNEFKIAAEQAYHLAKKIKRVDLLAIASVRFGMCTNDKEKIKKGLELLKWADEEILLLEAKKEIELYSSLLN